MTECKHLSNPITQASSMCGSQRGTLVHDMREFNCLDCKAVYDKAAREWGTRISWNRPREWTRDAPEATNGV
jgi:hypothetical protein